MQAVVSVGPGLLQLQNNVPIPNLDNDMAGQVLVKVQAVALNHSDWKMADFSPRPGSIRGYDMAGTVVAVGTGVSRLAVGDTVAGVTSISGGAFAEFTLCYGDLLVKVPKAMDVVQASTLGVALTTSGLALFGPEFLGLNMPGDSNNNFDTAHNPSPPPQKNTGPRGWTNNDDGSETDSDSDNEDEVPQRTRIPILVYGASSATGTILTQLLHLSGYAPIAVCSPRHFVLLKSRGATSCFDYHSLNCAMQIKQHTNSRLAYVVDCITTASSMKLCYEAMGSAGGRYVSLDPFSIRIEKTRKEIKASFCYALTIFGLPVELAGDFARDAKPEDHKLALNWMKLAEALLGKGKIQAHPAVVKPGGLAGVIAGIDLLRKGDVSGQKLVYKV